LKIIKKLRTASLNSKYTGTYKKEYCKRFGKFFGHTAKNSPENSLPLPRNRKLKTKIFTRL